MSFLAPFSLLLAFLAIPILVMYMLKMRRREVHVSSTLLWHAVLRDRQANRPWQKLRRNLLLFLQLAILTGLILALARPAIAVPSISSESIVVILDASASMNATDVAPNRFEAARAAANTLIDGLTDNSQMTLIQAGAQPKVLMAAEDDRVALRDALRTAAPTNGLADWNTVFALAAGAAASQSSQSSRIVIISDGGIPEIQLPPLPGEVSYIPVGSSANNLGFSALALREAGNKLELFVKVSNYSDRPRQVLLSIYQDEGLIHAQTLDIPSKADSTLNLMDLRGGKALIRAKLEPAEALDQPLDDLPLDDIAFAVHQIQKNRRILLISRGNFFLEQVLGSLPDVSAYRALPSTMTPEGSGGNIQLPADSINGQGKFDLYVLDGLLPSAPESNVPILPAGNLLLINPPPTALFNVTGTFTDTQDMQVNEHPLTNFLDWRGVHIAQAHFVETPPWAEILVRSAGRPLIFAGETEGRRVAALTFDLLDSDLPLQVAFPILFANLVDYLAPRQSIDAPDNLLPGEGVNIFPGTGVEEVAIASPSGKIFSFQPGENGVTFAETGELGLYAVNFLKKEAQSAEFFSTNLFSAVESDISPAETIRVGYKTIQSVEQEKLGKRELWTWFVLLAVILLALEWWVFQRRP